MFRKALFVSLFLAGVANASEMKDIFKAIGQVESGNKDSAVGDGGASVGRYQIKYAYWKDSGVPGKYSQVKNKDYAEKVMLAYWKRYCPTALKNKDVKTLSAVHNGGPKGYKVKAAQGYARKVMGELNKIKRNKK